MGGEGAIHYRYRRWAVYGSRALTIKPIITTTSRDTLHAEKDRDPAAVKERADDPDWVLANRRDARIIPPASEENLKGGWRFCERSRDEIRKPQRGG